MIQFLNKLLLQGIYKKAITIIFITLIINKIIGQNTFNLNKTGYKKGVISLFNERKVQASNIHIFKDSIDFISVSNGKKIKMPLSYAKSLKLKVGNYNEFGALIGGSTMGLCVASVYTIAKKKKLNISDKGYKRSIVLVGGGLGIGGLIGALIPKWEIYKLGDKKIGTIEVEPNFYTLGASLKFSM